MTQEELAERLNQAGFNVTQATVSRDIRELKLSKTPVEGGRQKYVVMHTKETKLSEKYVRVLKDGFESMDMAQNILVIKTVSGMAMAVGAAIDSLKLDGIVGCIAGDDTLLLAVKRASMTETIIGEIKHVTKFTY